MVTLDPLLLHADSEGTDAQADLSLCWAHSSFCCFRHAQAHIDYRFRRSRLRKEGEYSRQVDSRLYEVTPGADRGSR